MLCSNSTRTEFKRCAYLYTLREISKLTWNASCPMRGINRRVSWNLNIAQNGNTWRDGGWLLGDIDKHRCKVVCSLSPNKWLVKRDISERSEPSSICDHDCRLHNEDTGHIVVWLFVYLPSTISMDGYIMWHAYCLLCLTIKISVWKTHNSLSFQSIV